MRRMAYSISMLLSFMVLLSHQLIPHHHHEEPVRTGMVNMHTQAHQHSHHREHGHHHHHHRDHHSTSDAQKHPIPPHDHAFVSDDYSFVRLNVGSDQSIKSVLLLFQGSMLNGSVTNPLLSDTEWHFSDKPFLVHSLFQPGALSLRAPPSMA